MRSLRISAFFVLLLCAFFAHGQNYNNPGGLIQTCSGNFYDTGGAGGTYGNNQLITTTICSNNSQCISVNFTAFNLESGYDYLMIYDGPSANAPLIGTYSGTTLPGTITATRGCLTFVFDTDGSITRAGWAATISCSPCPPPPPCTGTTPSCPLPDDCSNACSLGTLTAPPACPSTGTSSNVFCLSNVGATASRPYLPLSGCQPTGTLPGVAADVWYTFIASSNILDVTVMGLNSPSIGFYEGNNCTGYVGRGCAVGGSGYVSATFLSVIAGRRYYLRISGADTTDVGDFTLSITSRRDCDPCLINYTLTASPLPVNAVYSPGERVHFCLTISQWSPTAVNWLHGVVPTFGSGWDLSTLTYTAPPSCDGYGSWRWYNSVTSTATGTTAGPGFFYESTQGCPAACNPNNPGDNYGDNCTGAVNFVFCFDITVKTAPPAAHGDNLNVSVNVYGDGETGSWTSFACAADPMVDIFATLSDCPQPLFRSQQVSCNGGQDGHIIANAHGIAPYTYTWLDTAGTTLRTTVKNTPDTLNNLAAGTYTVQVLDNLGCYTSTDFTLTQPAAAAVNTVPINISCFGQTDGILTIDNTGGTAPFEYSLDGSNFQPSNTFAGLSAGSYTITVRDAGACISTGTGAIVEPALLTLALDASSDVTCYAGDNGSATATAAGGTLPYEYSMDGTSFQPSGTFGGFTQGSYVITVRDARACTATVPVTINEPLPLTITLDSIHDAACITATNGSIYTTVLGGTQPYVFQWSNQNAAEDNVNVAGNTDYILTVRDAHQCVANDLFHVPAGTGITATTVAIDVTCNGETNGSAQVNVSNGTAPFVYAWSNGSPLQTMQAAAGIYSVTVTDANNCADTTTATISEPPLLSLQGTTSPSTCAISDDGAIEVVAAGGIGPYLYTLDGSSYQASGTFIGILTGNYQAWVQDANNCMASVALAVGTGSPFTTTTAVTDVSCAGGTDGTASVSTHGYTSVFTYYWNTTATDSALSGLRAGNYFVTVTDSNGCVAYNTATIAEPSAMTLTADVTHITCNGAGTGAISIEVFEGIPGYTYLWSNGETTSAISSIAAGTYSVEVTDNNNCTLEETFSITEPSQITLSISATDITCHGGNNGAATVTAAGGTTPFTFTWGVKANYQTTSSAVNLGAGVYSVTVTDANNCTDSASISIAEPEAVLLQLDTVINPLCMGGATGGIEVSATGGTGAYDFSWNNDASYNGLHPAGLIAGDYSVTVSDANGCTDSLTATLTNPAPLTVAIFPADTNISYGDSLQLVAVHTPASAEPSYIWEPVGDFAWCIAPCSNPVVSPLIPTTFSVVIVDPNTNCTATAQAFVNVEVENVIYPPNAFTPDGDGVNDEFEVFFGPSLVSMDYMIFNRWGEKLFQTTTLGDFWDGTYRGKKMNPGVYVYAIKASFLNGEDKMYKGSFTLLR